MHKSQGIKNFAFPSDFNMHITKENCLLRSTLLISFLHIVSGKISTLICRTKLKFILNQFGHVKHPILSPSYLAVQCKAFLTELISQEWH